jgi:peptidyl-prolyl cis-trans isomerase SurA
MRDLQPIRRDNWHNPIGTKPLPANAPANSLNLFPQFSLYLSVNPSKPCRLIGPARIASSNTFYPQLKNCHPEQSAVKSKDLRLLFLATLAGLTFLCLSSSPAHLQAQSAPSSAAQPVVLDRVVAVVNNQAILASDVNNEMRLAVLDPGRAGLGDLTPQRALGQLISRALIQQQIRQEDAQATEPTTTEIDARLSEIRKEVPACVHLNCASDEGWKAFLAAHDLTPERVRAYLRSRIQILRFIEERFRQGIRITPEEIEKYYKETLVPQYAPGEAIPLLEEVSPRIQEILLQRQVNVLFDDWLQNLRKQGDVEVLDPSLAAPQSPSGSGLSTPLHSQGEKESE